MIMMDDYDTNDEFLDISLKVWVKSQTMNVSRQFLPENSAIVKSLHSLLLDMFFNEFVSSVKDETILPMIGNLYQFLPSTCSCKSPECSHLSNLPSPYTR